MKEATCCFFGHRDAADNIENDLRQEIRSLIVKENTRKFYVGNQGRFDNMVLDALREMKKEFPNINYAVVLAYMPGSSVDEYTYLKPQESLYPDGLEKVPKRFTICRRNDWMLKQSDTVICYVRHSPGGAGTMIEKAFRQGKRVINLAEK